MTFYFEGGIQSFVRYLNRNRDSAALRVFYVEKEVENIGIEVAVQYTDAYARIGLSPLPTPSTPLMAART